MTPNTESSSEYSHIVFFDGVCGLCNKSVDWILARDLNHRFMFAPLQGPSAQKYLPKSDIENMNSIVVFANGKPLREFRAVIEILIVLGPPWLMLAKFLKFIPVFLGNLGYNMIAKCRYKFWGKSSHCRVPTPEERKRFLP